MVEVSIIVPVYNVENYLKKCVQSILLQTFKDFEVILVDDGSTDQSGKLCDELACLDERISVVHQKNRGLSAARNAGLAMAKGKYVAFIDSDDWILEDMIAVLHELILKKQADIAECNYIKVSKESEIKQPDLQVVELIGEEKNLELYSERCFGAIVVWNKLYDIRLFDNLLFCEGRRNEDQIITPQLFYKANKIVSTNHIGYCYFQRPGSIMHSSFSLKNLEALDAYKDTRNFLIQKQLYQALEYHDATYAFLILKYIRLLKKSRLDNKRVIQLKREFDTLLKCFLKNKTLNYKSKLIMLWKRVVI